MGRTGLKVSEVCLGTMTFGMPNWGIDEKSARQITDLALASGVNFIDTANSYAGGESERLVGKLLKGRRDKLILATKVFNPMGPDINDSGTSRYHILREVEASLRRLQTDYIDLYQIHHVDWETPTEERLRALDDLVHQGKVRYLGVTNEYATRLLDALWISETKNLARYDCLQLLYNLLSRDAEEEIIPLCRERGLGMIVWAPLAAGILTGKYPDLANPTPGTRLAETAGFMTHFTSGDGTQVLSALAEAARQTGRSMAQVALRWLLDRQGMTSVIVGSTSASQFRDNLGCTGWQLDKETSTLLDNASRLRPRYPHAFQAGMHQRRADAVKMPGRRDET